MKFDLYYMRKPDNTYKAIQQRLYYEKDSDIDWVNEADEDRLYELAEQYEHYKASVCENAEELTDFLFALHDNNYHISRETNFETKIFPHIEEDTLVLNTETHEIRAVKRVDMETVEVYNHDNIKSSSQKWGYVRWIREVWDRSKCLPIDMNNGTETPNFHYGSELGQHPKFDQVAHEDLCEW